LRITALISGRGGQGVVEAGNLLALGFMYAGMRATVVPTYGPQTRGGRVESAVVGSSESVDDPLPSRYDVVLLADPLALKRCERVEREGLLLINSSLIDQRIEADARVIRVEATRIAERVGQELREPRILTGTVLLGALSGAGYVPLEWLINASRTRFQDPRILEANLSALRSGVESALIR
jgi:Pyruvate/2-oxoacid:ferredoxin oxidoreductase gamma subunit